MEELGMMELLVMIEMGWALKGAEGGVDNFFIGPIKVCLRDLIRTC